MPTTPRRRVGCVMLLAPTPQSTLATTVILPAVADHETVLFIWPVSIIAKNYAQVNDFQDTRPPIQHETALHNPYALPPGHRVPLPEIGQDPLGTARG